jgi:hypothetical protein
MDQAVRQDRFLVAGQLSKLALAEAKKGLDRELFVQVQYRIAELAERVKAREQAAR